MPEKIIRDPVHDVIAFRLERPLDGLLFALLNAAEVQRLRRIRQLGMAHMAYPGADHSRYSHSLGVMETARRMLDRLRQSHRIDPEGEMLCVVGALLHDLGHGPFSHVFERVSEIHHERLTQRIILDPTSEVHRILIRHEKTLPERLVEFLRCGYGADAAGRGKRTFFCDILSSQLDADRFDYLLRDNHMTGSRYGFFDLQWLLHALVIDEGCDRLAVGWKGVSAVEAYLQARFNMYRNVYFHKVVRSAEGMVKLALQRAKRLAVQDRLEWPGRDSNVFKALTGQRLSIEEFTDLDDISVWHALKLWTRSDDAVLANLARGLLYRRVYKTIDISRVTEEQAERMLDAATCAVRDAGGEPSYELFVDVPAETPYESFHPEDCATADEILVRDVTGTLTPFGAVSPLTPALNRQLMFRRIHVAESYRDVVERAVKSITA